MNIIINNNNAYNTHQAMMKELAAQREVALYCDIHGHSRKCNMFMYGCSSKHPGLRLKERVFPFLLHNESLMFSYDDCNFKVQRCKESTARVVSWRELAIPNSYTLEMSLGGGDFGQDPAVRPPQHFTEDDYLEMGRLLCEAILDMYDPGRVRLEAAVGELELLHPDMKRTGGEDILSIDAEAARSSAGRDRDNGDDEGASAGGATRKKSAGASKSAGGSKRAPAKARGRGQA